MTSHVRSLLEGLDAGVLSIPCVADRLGVSARTMVRHLQAEGTTFQQLLDDVRRRHAARALADGNRSIAEIALALGYASSANFGHSFRRWFGTTPSGYVRQLREPRHPE